MEEACKSLKLVRFFLFFSAEFFFSQIFLRGRVLTHRFHRYTQIFFIMIFLHRISRMNRRHSCLSDYSRIFAELWPLANGSRPIYAPVVLVTQISLMTQIFLRGRVLSHRFHRYAQIFFIMIFLHRISRMIGRHSCLPDYSRNFAEFWPLANGLRPIYAPVVFCHADFADDADFSSWKDFVPQISQIYTDFLWNLW